MFFSFDLLVITVPLMMLKVLFVSSALNAVVASVVIGTALVFANTRVMLTATDPFLD